MQVLLSSTKVLQPGTEVSVKPGYGTIFSWLREPDDYLGLEIYAEYVYAFLPLFDLALVSNDCY